MRSKCLGIKNKTMKRTDPEIIEAMNFIKQKHNGELPYQFDTLQCANMMAKYLKHNILT